MAEIKESSKTKQTSFANLQEFRTGLWHIKNTDRKQYEVGNIVYFETPWTSSSNCLWERNKKIACKYCRDKVN